MHRTTLWTLPPRRLLALLAVVGPLLTTVTPAQVTGDVVSGLWLCHLTANEARLVLWDPEMKAPPVRFGVRGEPPRTVEPGGGPLRAVHLEGLSPATVYEVTCGWRRTRFETPRADEPRLRIGVLGHTGGTHPARRTQPESVVDALRALRPDLVLHAGDAVYNCHPEAFHREFLRLHDPIMRRAPVYLAPGNHEAGWPRGAPTHAIFRKALPYPHAKGTTDDDVFWVVERGPVRFVFVSYFKDRLLPGQPQRAWLDRLLSKRTTPFTVVVGGLSKGTFPQRDAFIASLDPEKVDLVIGGDAEGLMVRPGPGVPFLYVGAGGGRKPHPYALIEATRHRLVVNAYDISGAYRGHLDLLDGHRYTSRKDLMPALRTPSYALRTKARPREDGSVAFEVPQGQGAVTLISRAPLPEGAQGVQVDLRVEAKKTTAARQDVFLVWAPETTPRVLHRSQPFHLPMDGSIHRLTIPIPATDPISGKPARPSFIGFALTKQQPDLAGIVISKAYAF